MHILVELDGVLKGHRNDEPITYGLLLIAQLSAYNQISFFTSMKPAEVRQWLDVNKVVDYDHLLDSSVSLEGEELTHRQIRAARAYRHIDLLITANPSTWVFSFEQGIPSMMFGQPAYLRPEFRPDAPKKIRSWDQIQEAVAKQNAALTQDARLSRTEGLNFE
jgi:hypothetical protein